MPFSSAIQQQIREAISGKPHLASFSSFWQFRDQLAPQGTNTPEAY
jgi:hypothetical protein